MGVAYWTLDTWPRSKWKNGVFRGESVMRCAWSDRADLLLELDGSAWPYNDGPTDARPYEAEVKPWGRQVASSSTTTNYNWAFVKVVWMAGHHLPRLLSGLRITEYFGPTQEYLRVSPEAADLKWEDGETAVDDFPPLVRYELIYTLTIHNVLAVPSAIYDRVHCCNSNAVVSYTLNKSFAAETLLYVPPTIKWSFTLGKVPTYDITYRFHFRPMGWNKFWNMANGAWEWVKINGVIQKPYTPVAFA